MVRTLISLIIMIIMIKMPVGASSWKVRKAEGWAWYEDPSKEREVAVPSPISSTEQMAAARNQIEEALSRAVLSPTEENVQEYMELQKRWMGQSALFASAWSRLLLSNPSLDPTAVNPVSQYGNQVHKRVQYQKTKSTIHSLSKDHGMLFFYRGGDSSSQAFSRVVKAFEKRYGWQVMGITLDGLATPEFLGSKTDNGIAENLDLAHLPALFVVNPSTGELTPISYGPVALDKIENNIMLQFSEAGKSNG
jgi:conjugal transfer pilus assembly protein TraF